MSTDTEHLLLQCWWQLTWTVALSSLRTHITGFKCINSGWPKGRKRFHGTFLWKCYALNFRYARWNKEVKDLLTGSGVGPAWQNPLLRIPSSWDNGAQRVSLPGAPRNPLWSLSNQTLHHTSWGRGVVPSPALGRWGKGARACMPTQRLPR